MSNIEEPELIQPISTTEIPASSQADSIRPDSIRSDRNQADSNPVELNQPETKPTEEPVDRTMKLELFRVLIAALFLVLFAYDTWQGIDSAITLSSFLQLNGAQWGMLIAAIVVPILLWLLACLLFWRRSRLQLMLGLLVAWMTSAALFIDLKILLGVFAG